MKPLKNLYAEIVSLENLYRAAHATLARGRRYYGEGASFSFHLEREVSRLHRDLAAGAYRHGRYQIFQIRDPKPRTLAAAGFRDRVLHHAVHDVVEPGLDPMFIFESYACRKGKGTHRALDRAHRFLRGREAWYAAFLRWFLTDSSGRRGRIFQATRPTPTAKQHRVKPCL